MSDVAAGVDPAPEELRAVGREYLRAMRDRDSVFTPGKAIWTKANADELVAAFVDRPDIGGRSFADKLADQLAGASDGALQLFAELWYASLAPLADYAPETKRSLIGGILGKMTVPVPLPPVVESALGAKAFNGGVAFKTRRPFQLALLVRIAVAVTALDGEERKEVLSEPRRWKALLESVLEPKEPAQRKALSWLLFPDYFLSVVSTPHRLAIRKAFADLLDGSAIDEDDELFQIRSELSRRRAGASFYTAPIVDQWDPERTLSGSPVTPEALAKRSRFRTPGYAIVSAALDLIGEGRWSTYSDVASVAGLTASQVGEYLNLIEHPTGYRVIKHDGTTYEKYGYGERDLLPEGVTPRSALEAEGIEFDLRGVADPAKRVSKEDLREQLDAAGLLPQVTRRGWLIRGSSVNGKDLVPTWREEGWISLAASNLRQVAPGITRDELKPIVDEDYAHASYHVKSEKLDEFHAFLTRMEQGHLIATVDQGRLYVGNLVGDARYEPSPEGDSNLVRDVAWVSDEGIDYADLPAELATKLKVQRDVVDLTQQLETLEGLLETETEQAPPPVYEKVVLQPATAGLAAELHVSQAWLQESIDLLNDRPQLIFYGPPGTGKTFLAQAIARHVAGENVRLVQFHPAYSYEDFFEGYRPTSSGGFELKPGPMRKVVDQALANPRDPYVLIIDEINRGNLAKVFGELYFLLEYRKENVELLYADEEFNLPENVFIIGTMNTADRSIALVDAAMRRRFAFLPLHPSEEPTNGILRSWLAEQGLPVRVADLLDELNRRIEDADFKIGPSYFMRPAVHGPGGLERTWRTSILPLLEEHHFGELTGQQVVARYGLDAVVAAVDKPAVTLTEASDESTDSG
ncbi:AAA family ATPase [Nocardioides sp. ChNu-99]|uniref:AAA family ATPase n=1 Tax=Nocardioides sp. ChNu-99 TaxID=2839897 RepID=UPI0024054379|nr:AAA family ATPase [Nocardioides sp. ChNu-99]MDF9717342.1 AAA family ATPase [Nocardioides sp. ChNu-99]